MECGYHERNACRSCTAIGAPIGLQRATKQDRALAAVIAPQRADEVRWLEAFGGDEANYRNKAKMVVGGSTEAPTLGILDAQQLGVDLRDCGIITQGLRAAMPPLSAFITAAGLAPYDVPSRRGELKHLLVTESPDGELMVRFVLRSTESLPRIRKHLDGLLAQLPIRVATANILPTHVALLEGEEEHLLTEESVLPMRLDGLTLRLPPRSFFQTNTVVAAALYRQSAEWADSVFADVAEGADSRLDARAASRRIVDLYCGVGGFALALAGPGRSVLGIETSAEAIAAAEATATAAGLPDTTFIAGDATQWLASAEAAPDLVVVNPPRRGLGEHLTATLEASGVPSIIYSSCNPDSLAADLARMPSYRPVEARLFDMFPQTSHLEVMVLLER